MRFYSKAFFCFNPAYERGGVPAAELLRRTLRVSPCSVKILTELHKKNPEYCFQGFLCYRVELEGIEPSSELGNDGAFYMFRNHYFSSCESLVSDLATTLCYL